MAAIVVAQVVNHRVAILDEAHRRRRGVIAEFGIGKMRQVDIGDIAFEIAEAGKAEILPRLVAAVALAQRGGACRILPCGMVGDPRWIDPDGEMQIVACGDQVVGQLARQRRLVGDGVVVALFEMRLEGRGERLRLVGKDVSGLDRLPELFDHRALFREHSAAFRRPPRPGRAMPSSQPGWPSIV